MPMSRRQSLERPGIISPQGPFLTPSPSSSISASPRHQPSPSVSPFSQDVLLLTGSTITNTTQEQERKAATPSRRPSLHQLSASPNAGTIIFQPSPSQSPAVGATIVGVTGNEFNTTLVGSNNILLNKKGVNKRTPQSFSCYGQATSASNNMAQSTPHMASSPKGTSKKATQLSTTVVNANSSPLTNESPISSPTSGSVLKPPTPQPILQQFPVVNAGNQFLQFIQGPQLIATAGNQARQQLLTSTTVQNSSPQPTINNSGKITRGPQQILPKPQTPINQLSDKNVITQQSKNITIHQTGQISQSPQPQQNVTTSSTQPAQGGQIILPTGNLNTPQLLLNQMPVLVQQNTPQGVQLILRPPTPQLATPSLVIHNTRPQLQQPQPQQLLRILNTNGPMQLTAAPTFIVSSQANLIQQNLQNIKTNTPTSPMTQLSGLHTAAPRSQQLAAAINSHILGQSVAQLQNLQLNGNLAQIHMSNGLNGPIISQLPTQFQQSLTNFNQINQNINLNQLNGTNLQQIAAAAAAAGAAFQSSTPPQVSEIQMPSVVSAQNIQFSTNNNQINTLHQSLIQPVASVTPDPVRNTTSVLQNVVTPQQTTTVLVQPDNIVTPVTPRTMSVVPKVNNSVKDSTDAVQKTKKPKSRKKKQSVSTTVAKNTCSKNISQTTTLAATATTTVNSERQTQQQSQIVTGTGKLDLANVIKLCGIMEDDDYIDSEVETQSAQIQDKSPTDNQNLQPLLNNQSLQHQQQLSPQQHQQQRAPLPKQTQQQQQQQQHHVLPTQNQQFTIPTSTASTSDIMITIPSQNNDFPITFTIPTSQCDNKMFSMVNENALPAYVNNIASDVKGLEAQNIVIKIDPNESGQTPYTISIPRIQNEEMLQHNTENIQSMPTQQTISCITSTSSQMNVPKSNSTVINSTINQPMPGNSTTNSNTLCISGFVNPSNNHITPTIQSQINEIQNQLMGVTTNPVVGSTVVHSTGATVSQISAEPTTKTITTTAAIKPRRKPGIKRNGKKVETISTSVGSVPSQIGNIQISQIDSAKINNQHMVASNVIENKIQITPILDNKFTQGSQQQQQQQQQTIPFSIQQLNHATMQQQSFQQHVQSNYNFQQIKPSTIQNTFSNTTKQQQQISQAQNTAINFINEQNNANNKKIQQSNNMNSVHGTLSGGNISLCLPGTTTTTTTTTSTSSFISQLTGSLSLAVAEDGGRLLLRHDPNNPQDAQSQIILQAIVSGALPNITIINEAIDKRHISAVQQQQQQQQSLNTNSNNSNNTTSHNNLAVETTAKVSLLPPPSPQTTQISSTRTTQTITHNQRLTLNSTTNTSTSVSNSSSAQCSNVVSNDSNLVLIQKNPLDAKNNDNVTSLHNNKQHQQHQEVQQSPTVVDQNSSRLIALPKINSNQQLFSLNTITNQITHINSSQNEVSLSPMETLLIVPAGINAQQLAQCMSQGQIHFNSIGQVTQSPSPLSAGTLSMSRVQQQVVYPQQHQSIQPLQFVQQAKQVANVAPIIDTSKTKLDTKPKKAKQSRKQKLNQSVNEVFNKTIKPVQKLDLNTKPNMNPVQVVQPNIAKENMKSSSETNQTNTATTSATTTTTSSTIHSFQTQTGTKLVGVTAPMQQQHSQQKNLNTNQCNSTNNSPGSSIMINNNNISTSSQSSSSQPPSVVYTCNSAIISHQTPAVNVIPGNNLINNTFNRLHSVKYTNSMPPLISVSAISQTVPKVQTIQLTPQQQQLLQTVQIQIQQLSGKLQNKNLLATLNIPSDFDSNNPIYNKPLPHLNNIQNLSDTEIHAALQRLFIEQQKILAAGKVIPTISASPSHGIIQSPLVQNQPSTSSSAYQSTNVSIQSCQLQSNNSITATTTLQTVGTQPTYTCSPSNKSITVSSSVSCATKSSYSAKNEIQSIPSNVVQPNNHNSSTPIVSNNANATHRVHVYPIQHHSETNKQSAHVSTPLSTHQNQNSTKIKVELQSAQNNQLQQAHSNFIQASSKLSVENQSQNQNQMVHHVDKVSHTVPVDIKIEKTVKLESQENIISENSPPTSLDITKANVPRHFFFERQLKVDHESCTNPDYLTPFQDKYEAIKRLTRYHCVYQKDEDIDSTEEEFERVAVNLQNKYRELTTKYQSLLLQESMLLHRTSETCLIDHLMVDDLQRELLELRNEAANLSNVAINKQNQNNLLSNLVMFNSCKTIKKETNNTGAQQQQQDLIDVQYQKQKQSSQLHLSPQIHYQQQSGENEKYKVRLSKQLQSTQIIDKNAVDNSLIKNEIKSEPCDIAFDKCSSANISSNKSNKMESDNSTANIASSSSLTEYRVDGEQLNMTDMKNQNNSLSNSIIKDEKDSSFSVIERNCSFNNSANVISSSDSVTSMNSSFMHEEQQCHELKHENCVKKELESLDIESEIIPSFIMKKIDTQLNSGQVTTTAVTTETEGINSVVTSSNLNSNPEVVPNSEFSIDYFVNSTSHQSSAFNSTLQFPDNLNIMKRKDDDQKNEPYDEWYCIQRELNLITEKKTESAASLTNHSQSHNHHSDSVTDKNVDKHLSDIFESSPKVENQLPDLFSSNSNSVTNDSNLKDQQLETNNMNLTDIFVSDSIANKSVETRLEAMFGESPIEKSRDVESRLDEFFQESSPADEADLHGGTNGVERMAHFSEIDSNNKRQWNNTNETSASVSYARRSCMMASYIEENHVTSNHPRWTIDHQFDFIGDANENTADETRKRPWNGDIISNTIDHPSTKKTCYDKSESDLDHDILGLHTSGDSDNITNDIIRHSMHANSVTDMHCQYLNSNSLMNMQSINNHNHIQHHHHHHNHNQQMQATNSLIDLSSGSNLFESNLNSSSINANMSGASSSSMSSNFEEDINRHVQNAIDSILNLQNSESDSLNFSLEHSVGSFLGDNTLEPHGDSNVQTSNLHCVLTGGNGKRRRIDDLSDCLISGSNLINNGENNSMMVESSTSVISSSTATTSGSGVISDGITDFSCVSNVEDAVKSIMTS